MFSGKSSSGEMFSGVLWFNIIYIPISVIGWMGINLLVDQTTNKRYQQIIRFGLGLATIFSFMQFAGGGVGTLAIIVATLCIYIISFLIASTAYWNRDDVIQQKEENTIIQ